MTPLEKTERILLAAVMALLLLAVLGPSLSQAPNHHDFADQRDWGFLPCALDVLSNLAFACWGGAGLCCLFWPRPATAPALPTAQRQLAALFFAGLLLTTAASAWYHWQPDDAGLAADRLGMVVAFAGLLGLAVTDRVTARAGKALALGVLLMGPLSVWAWATSGNVLPWASLQFGGMALVLWLACVRPATGALAVRWGLVILIYAVAKLLEQADAWVFVASSELVSGHSLKHVAASCAAWPVIAAIRKFKRTARQFSAESVQLAEPGRPQAATRAGRRTIETRSQS